MEKNAYNKIKAVIESGHNAKVIYKDKSYDIIVHEITTDKKFINDFGSIIPFNEKDIISITPLPRPIKKLKVGDKVIILENLRGVGDYVYWDDEKKEMIGKVFTVEVVFNSYDGVYYEINGYHFPHNCVAPYFEDDERKEVCEDDMYKIDDKIYTKDEIKKALEFVNKFKEVNECLSNN